MINRYSRPMTQTLALVGVTLLGVLSPLPWRSVAQAEPLLISQSSSCSAAVTKAKRTLESGRQLTVQTETYNARETYDSYPAGRPTIYRFIIDGSAAESIMNSPRFMQTLSATFIAECSTASAVTINFRNSGFFVIFGLMTDGSVQAFDCIEDRYEVDSVDELPADVGSPWGYQYCSI